MIELEKQGEVLILRMDAGENRFGPDAIRLWHECLDEAEAMEGPKALVTTGSGKFYSNGLDLDHMGSDEVDPGALAAVRGSRSAPVALRVRPGDVPVLRGAGVLLSLFERIAL